MKDAESAGNPWRKCSGKTSAGVINGKKSSWQLAAFGINPPAKGIEVPQEDE